MTELDALAPGPAGAWAYENICVRREPANGLDIRRAGATVQVVHGLTSADLGERLVPQVTARAKLAHLDQREFELVMVGLVRSTIADPVEAWSTYYRNSLDDFHCGTAEFAPIHRRAEALAIGSILDMGSCFGFFPLTLAMNGHSVTATDLSAGTMHILGTVAPHLGVTLDTLTCDAADVPVPNDSVDTVTALHLLEHVDAHTGTLILAEAMRIARQRVVVAVPFETQATVCHGHVRIFDEAALTELGLTTGAEFQTSEHHGGWLVIDKIAAPHFA